MFRKLKLLCFLVGGYKIGELGYHSFQGIQTYYLSTSPDLQSRYGSGNYALISESSTQIGQEFSKVLASNSQNLILLSQNKSELLKLQADLKSLNPNIDVKAFEIDSQVEDPSTYQSLFKNFEGLDIGLLINTVEMAPLAQGFEQGTLRTLRNEVMNNLLPGTLLLNHLLGQFQKRSQNSAIITIGSAFGDFGSPFNAPSAGNMGFMNYLTRSLAYEVDEKIDVLLVTPGPLQKDGVYGEYERFNTKSEDVVKNSLRNLGGKKWIVGCPKQAALYYLMRRMPKLTEKMLMVRGLMNIQANK